VKEGTSGLFGGKVTGLDTEYYTILGLSSDDCRADLDRRDIGLQPDLSPRLPGFQAQGGRTRD